MRLEYQPALDGLRGVALLSVMGCHFARNVATGGALGVDIFFVLSGYLITTLLIAEHGETGRIDYGAFILRRIRRLMPALAVVLMFCIAVSDRIWASNWAMARDLGAAATYVTNLQMASGAHESPVSHTWSLSIEEQFYIVWPLVCLWLIKLPRQTAARLLMAAWLLFTVMRCMMAPTAITYFLAPWHATGLLMGSTLAFRPVRTQIGAIALAALVALVIVGQASLSFAYAIAVAELATVFVIANPPVLLSNGLLRWIGKISYGTYLWHIPLLWAAPEAGLLVLVPLSLLMGALSYYLVEPWATGRHALRFPTAKAEQPSG